MAATGLTRCPSLTQNAKCLGRATSLSELRRSCSLSVGGRRPSLQCRAVQRPAQNDPERPSDLLPTDSGLDWELDASVMPWAAGLHRLTMPGANEPGRQPIMFYPTSERNGSSEHNEDRTIHQFPAETDAPCYVILFGVGEEDTEGIYTLRTTADDPSGTSVDTVVAFENEVDAQRFATLLEASLAYKPCVYPISWMEITEWCEDNNNRCRLEPAGSLLIPPESNVERTDWERALALQRGEYKVLEAEPLLAEETDPVFAPTSAFNAADYLAPGFFIDGPDWVHSQDEYDVQDDVAHSADHRMAEANLAGIRAELERLMSQ